MSDALFDRLTPEGLRALVPELTVGGSARPPAGDGDRGVDPDPELLAARGFVEVRGPGRDHARVLEGALVRLEREGLPLAAVYVFDEVWDVGAALASRCSRALAVPYELVLDLWAFSIPPGRGGWKAHRGVYAPLDRRRPEFLNAWVALSDAGIERSCMYLVPLDDDRAYRAQELETIDVAAGAGVALPLASGDALAWNANVLHWGGPCALTAEGPRRSLTFTLRRKGAGAELGPAAIVEPHAFAPWRRLEVVASQILLYGERDPTITTEIDRWARITATLGERHGAR